MGKWKEWSQNCCFLLAPLAQREITLNGKLSLHQFQRKSLGETLKKHQPGQRLRDQELMEVNVSHLYKKAGRRIRTIKVNCFISRDKTYKSPVFHLPINVFTGLPIITISVQV